MAKNSEEKKHITRISATPSANTKVKEPTEAEKPVSETLEKSAKSEKVEQTAKNGKKGVENTQISKKSEQKATKKSKKPLKNPDSEDGRKPIGEVKLFARPFVALGRYIRDSWRELRLVRWPDRKATWKMTLAVLVYCAIMMIFILLLDTLFTFLFNLAFK